MDSEFIGQPMLIVGLLLVIINALVLDLAIDFALGHPKKNSQFGGYDEDHAHIAVFSWLNF